MHLGWVTIDGYSFSLDDYQRSPELRRIVDRQLSFNGKEQLKQALAGKTIPQESARKKKRVTRHVRSSYNGYDAVRKRIRDEYQIQFRPVEIDRSGRIVAG